MAKNLVYKATSDDREPPSGFVLKELETLSKGSITDCELIEQALLDRLKKNSANIKWKALRVIKHLALTGNPNLARSFQRQHESIRDCVNYTGTQHPLYGDELNERVRSAAKECIQAVFQGPTQSSSSHSDMEHKIRGYEGGPVNYGDKASTYKNTYNMPSFSFGGQGSSNSSAPSSGMPGMGNSYVPESPSVMDKVKDTMGSISSVFGMKKEEKKEFTEYEAPGPYVTPQIPYGNTPAPYGGSSGNPYSGSSNNPYGGAGGYRGAQPAVSNPIPEPVQTVGPRVTKPKQKRKKGQVVGMFAEDGPQDAPTLKGVAPSAGVGSSNWGGRAPPVEESRNYGTPASSTYNPSFNPGYNQVPASSASPYRPGTGTPSIKGNRGRGTEAIEKALIADLCSAAGVKSVPPKEKLDKISANWSSLDQWYIAEELDERLDEGEKWQVQKKALTVLETVAKIDDETLKEYFQENPDNLVILASSTTQSVAMKAKKLIQALEIDADIADDENEDVGGDVEAVEPAEITPPFVNSMSSAPAAVAPQADVAGLFGNLTIAGPTVVHAPQPAVATPSPFIAPSPKNTPAPLPAHSDDLLSFFGNQSTQSAPSAPRQTGFDFIQSVQSGNRNPELSFSGPTQVSAAPQSSINLVDGNSGESAFAFLGGTPNPAAPSPFAPSSIGGMNASGGMGMMGYPPQTFGGYPSQPAYNPAANPNMGFGMNPSGAAFGYGVPQGYGPSMGYAAPAPQFVVQAAPRTDAFAPAPATGSRSSNARKPDEFSFIQDMMSNH